MGRQLCLFPKLRKHLCVPIFLHQHSNARHLFESQAQHPLPIFIHRNILARSYNVSHSTISRLAA